MALVDAKFSNVEAFSITKLNVVKGEKFRLTLHPDKEGETKWLFYNDPVLDSKVEGNVAEITAVGVGESEIWIFDTAKVKIMELFINVYDVLPDPATSLGVKVGNPEPK